MAVRKDPKSGPVFPEKTPFWETPWLAIAVALISLASNFILIVLGPRAATDVHWALFFAWLFLVASIYVLCRRIKDRRWKIMLCGGLIGAFTLSMLWTDRISRQSPSVVVVPYFPDLHSKTKAEAIKEALLFLEERI